jgi:hypothetical protein
MEHYKINSSAAVEIFGWAYSDGKIPKSLLQAFVKKIANGKIQTYTAERMHGVLTIRHNFITDKSICFVVSPYV